MLRAVTFDLWQTLIYDPHEPRRNDLRLLAAEYPLALICNTGTSPGSVLRTLLSRIGLMQHYEVLVASDELMAETAPAALRADPGPPQCVPCRSSAYRR